MVTAVPADCRVCANSATVVDWTTQGWVAVENCPCGGFFIQKTLWGGRLSKMTEMECQDLAARIREWRAARYEVWISTTDSTLDGPLVLEAIPPLALADQPRS